MKDLIERQAVIEINRSYHGQMPNEVNYRILKEINELPSAQPEPQWIPVSEKLPGENEFVLVTFGWFGRKTDPGVNIDEIRDGDWMISEVVTAWMPLPEPYRAERRTDE